MLLDEQQQLLTKSCLLVLVKVEESREAPNMADVNSIVVVCECL
jgi:hypothetical protein